MIHVILLEATMVTFTIATFIVMNANEVTTINKI
jgi:hypothetical protein